MSQISQNAAKAFPVVFLNHGGGPMPLLNDPGHDAIVASWKSIISSITREFGQPSAIAVISAHFETQQPCVGSAAYPRMLYDYGGFPDAAYKLKYPAPGAPDLAKRMVERLVESGLKATLDNTRAFDHGVFVPLMMVFPDAKIPVVPVSVLRSQSAADHIEMGRALVDFRKEGVLFIGSGMSMHNFKYIFGPGVHGTTFNNELTNVLSDESLSAAARIERMKDVRAFAGVDESHPDGGFEHLMPLLTCVGLSEGLVGREASNVQLMGANVRDYVFA